MEINDIFVVKRPFKSNGQHFTPGSIVEPDSIRLFRNKVNEGKVVRLTDQSIESISLYIKRRTGEDILYDLKDTLNDTRADIALEYLGLVALENENIEDATGTDATGTDATGTDATGTDATGTDATGTDATGTDATLPVTPLAKVTTKVATKVLINK